MYADKEYKNLLELRDVDIETEFDVEARTDE